MSNIINKDNKEAASSLEVACGFFVFFLFAMRESVRVLVGCRLVLACVLFVVSQFALIEFHFLVQLFKVVLQAVVHSCR